MSVIEFAAAAARHRDAEATTWVRVEADVWVAYWRGMFGGMIVRRGSVLAACDLFGRDRGVFATVSAAQHDIEALLAHPSVRGWLDDVTALPT